MSTADLDWRPSACNLCYINCGIEVGVDRSGGSERIVRIRGDKANPRSQGYLCNKAAAIPSYVHHRDRLTSPLRRRADGGFDEIAWDVAIAEIAQKLQAVRSAHGGQSLALYGGGGQGNHAGGAYATALLRGLGSRNTFNALAQEKTGDFWVNGHLFGAQTCHTAEDIEHCDLLFVLGANPWIAHGFTNARDQLNAIRKDPARRLIVVDPRRSETAQVADLHLAVRPGGDAFLLGALLAILQRRGAFDEAFLAARSTGRDEVAAVLQAIPVDAWIEAAGVPRAQVEQAADLVVAAKAMVVRAELGIQQGLHSTLNSYLEKLLFLLTGHFGRRGTNALHSWLQPLWGNARGQRFAPTGTEIIAGLLPPNVFADAVLADHPDRLRAVWVDSSNPVNTAADTARVKQALAALDLLVVVDVAFTETAALADYVLPASSQYEKCEFTLFNFEFPTNYFHVRAPVLPPLSGTLPEPQIYSRLARALGLLPPQDELDRLTSAALAGPREFAKAFADFSARHVDAGPVMAIVLHDTLGAALPHGNAAAAPLWGAAQRLARTQPDTVRQALAAPAELPAPALGQALFEALVNGRSGIAFSHHDEVWSLLETADHKVRLAIPSLLQALATLDPASLANPKDFPMVLSAGQRRLQNANQILRDPAFRQRDPDGALTVHPGDLDALGAEDGDWLAVVSARGRLVVRAKADDTMRPGHVALPHGYGQSHPDAQGVRRAQGPAINQLTDSAWCDPVAGTPYHKHVPVRLELLAPAERQAVQTASQPLPKVATA